MDGLCLIQTPWTSETVYIIYSDVLNPYDFKGYSFIQD